MKLGDCKRVSMCKSRSALGSSVTNICWQGLGNLPHSATLYRRLGSGMGLHPLGNLVQSTSTTAMCTMTTTGSVAMAWETLLAVSARDDEYTSLLRCFQILSLACITSSCLSRPHTTACHYTRTNNCLLLGIDQQKQIYSDSRSILGDHVSIPGSPG